PTITTDMTITGPAAGVTVDGNNASRVFQIDSGTASSPAVALSGMTIANGVVSGDNGGGILNNHGTLTLTNCTLSGNRAFFGGGIYNDGSGGGNASLTVANCTFSVNDGFGGGGIGNHGAVGQSASVTLTNCTFSGNTA